VNILFITDRPMVIYKALRESFRRLIDRSNLWLIRWLSLIS